MKIKSRYYQRLALAAQWEHVVAGNFSGPAYGMHAHLVTGFSSTPSDLTAWADVTEAGYGGYAPQAMVLPTVEVDGTAGADGVCGMLSWAATDAVTPEVIVAIVYTDNVAAGNVLGIDVLENPVAMADATSGFSSVTVLDLPWDQNGKPATIIA